jgi:hypothetical protein
MCVGVQKREERINIIGEEEEEGVDHVADGTTPAG